MVIAPRSVTLPTARFQFVPRMLSFSKKTKGFFIDINGEAVLLARTSSPDAPMVVEEMREVPVSDEAAVQRALKELQGKKRGSYLHARCGIYPRHRLVRRTRPSSTGAAPGPASFVTATPSWPGCAA